MKTANHGGSPKKPLPMNYRMECNNKVIPVTLLITNYLNGNLAMMLQSQSGNCTEDFAVITINFPDELLPADQAYLDTNNLPELEQFVEENQLGRSTGRNKKSGYCTYPLYEFDFSHCMAHGMIASA